MTHRCGNPHDKAEVWPWSVGGRGAILSWWGWSGGGHGQARWPIWVSLDTPSPSGECAHSATPTWPDKGTTSRAETPQVNDKDLPRRRWTRCVLVQQWRRDTTSPCCRPETKWNNTTVFHPPNHRLLTYPTERVVPGTGERLGLKHRWRNESVQHKAGIMEGELLWPPFQRKPALIVDRDTPAATQWAPSQLSHGDRALLGHPLARGGAQ